MKAIGEHGLQFPGNREEAREWSVFTLRHALANRVLAVANTRVEGAWCAYINAVPGRDHEMEQEEVLRVGDKLIEEVALLLFPYFEGIPYAD